MEYGLITGGLIALAICALLGLVGLAGIGWFMFKYLVDHKKVAREVETESVVLVELFGAFRRVMDESRGWGYAGLKLFVPGIESFKAIPEWARPPDGSEDVVYLGEIRKSRLKSDDVPCQDGVEVNFVFDLVFRVRATDQGTLRGLFYGRKDALDRLMTEFGKVFSGLARLGWAQGVLDVRGDMLAFLAGRELELSWHEPGPDPANPGQQTPVKRTEDRTREIVAIIGELVAKAEAIGFELVEFVIRDAQPADPTEYELVKRPQQEMLRNIAADQEADRLRKLAKAEILGKMQGIEGLTAADKARVAQIMLSKGAYMLAFDGMSREQFEKLLSTEGTLTAAQIERLVNRFAGSGGPKGGRP